MQNKRYTFTMREIMEIYFTFEYDDIMSTKDFVEYVKSIGWEIEEDEDECKRHQECGE